MSQSSVLDGTMHKTHEWLNAIGDELGFRNDRSALAALRATLHAVRDRLTLDEMAQFGAQLPILVRGLYYEGWNPSWDLLRKSHDRDFVAAVRAQLKGHEELKDVARVAKVVLKVVSQKMSPDEVGQAIQGLPREVRELWEEARRSPAEGDKGQARQPE